VPIYAYKGLDRSGKEVKGDLNTDSINTAKQKVRALGIMLTDIREQKTAASSGGAVGKTISRFQNRVTVEALALMTRQFATLIRAKIPVAEALHALVEQVDNETLRLVMSQVRQKVTEGSSLADALGDHPKIFDHIYVNMVSAGEASGTLEIVLLRLADFTEAQMKLRNKIKGAMTYPVIMGIFGFVMMMVIFIFVIPKIAKIFMSRKMELPIQTKLSIALSNFLVTYWWLVIIGIIGGAYLFRRYINSTAGKSNWDSLILKLPIVGILTKMINVSRFCSTLATLLNSGVPILAALSIVKNLIPNVHMREAVEKARLSVSEGASLTGPLIASGHFPPLVTHMIRLGEKSGELEPMLKIVSENYEEQVESKIGGLTSILEPIMMVLMGCAVGFIVFSVVVPMMSMNSVR
jgi:general secretion pathway protein F